MCENTYLRILYAYIRCFVLNSVQDGKVSHEEMLESMEMFLSESFQEGDTFGTHDEL